MNLGVGCGMFDFSKRGLRLVIEGEVTLERLREALETAREEVALSMTGVTFRRANIYLNAFNESGEQLDFSDENGKSKIIRFPEFPGESAPRATDRSRSSILINIEKNDRMKYEQDDDRVTVCRSIYQGLNELTTRAIEDDAVGFVENLNRIIREVWEEMSPIESHWRAKGEKKPMPTYHLDGGVLMLKSPSWDEDAARRMRNPVYGWTREKRRDAQGYEKDPFTLVWYHPAWKEVVNRTLDLMGELEEKLS